MSNYKKDKSYIKQRLEYVSPVDYIIELENKIEYLEEEIKRLNNIIDELENMLENEIDYMEHMNCEVRDDNMYKMINLIKELKEGKE